MKCLQYLIIFLSTLIIEAMTSSVCNFTSCAVLGGRDGRDGREGRDGSDGRDGRDCVECAKGPMGPKGEQGIPGIKGEKGVPGIKGERGVAGVKGEKGVPGVKGGKGNTGAKGDRGLTGMTGKAGQTGAKGDKGSKGVCDDEKLAALLKKIETLESQVHQLQEETVKLDENKMIKQSVLPGGYSNHTADDLQWQSMHMAAAAACRGITATGGSGSSVNAVYPRSTGMSCTEVCMKSNYNNCDAELSLHGYEGKATTSQMIGLFYNHGCGDKTIGGHMRVEPSMKPDDIFANTLTYFSYCCCRKG